MIIPLLRVIFKSSDEVFQEATKYSGQWEWSKDGILNYLNYYLAQYALEQGRYATLIFICLFLVVMVFIKNLLTFMSSFFLSNLIQLSVRDFREKMYNKVLSLPMSFFSEERKGDLLSRFSADLKEVELSIKATTNAIFKDPFYIIGYIITLFIISIPLTIFILLFLPVAGFIISKISNGLKKRSVSGQENLGRLLSITEESIFGLRIIKSFNSQNFMSNRFKESSNNLFKVMRGINRRVFVASPVSEFLGVVATSGVLLYGGKLVFNGSILPDVFIGYIILFSQLISPFKSISKAIYDSTQGIAALDRIEQILNQPEIIKNIDQPVSLTSFQDKIAFNNVRFKYVQDWVINDISFEVKKGDTIAIVGHSGSGKTTLADLLIRFYDVSQGSIEIDGKNIKEVELNNLRSLMGVVTQDSILFNDTVANNIAFGSTVSDFEMVENAAKMANAHDFITMMKNGYDSYIGDGGNKLSGGQKQRLSIARALYKNPEILILDEATSSLDTASEKAVQQALDRLMENRTSLVIAHRLSTIQGADKIIVINNGEILETGTHQELIDQNNFYKKLIDHQSL